MTSDHRFVVPAVCAGLALAVTAPLVFASGFVLAYDMVFTPRPALLPSSIGLGPALPRGVPAEAAVALATVVVPGQVLQKLLLFGLLVAAGLGTARLVPTGSTVIRVVAAVAYSWNAFVAERLFIGHWPLLLAYAALPWVVLAGLALRRGDRRAPAKLVLAMLPAVLGPSGGLLAAGAAIAAAGRRRLAVTVPVAIVLNAPWWVPAVLHTGGARSDPQGVAAFAARGESWAGPVLSVLGLGGIWNADVAPATRDSPITPVVTLVLVGLTLVGVPLLARRLGARPARALLVLAAFGVLVAVAGAVPVLDEALRLAVAHVPGAGLLRDGQRFAAWWALLVALGFALGAESLAGRLADPLGRRSLLAGAVLLPLVALPDLAWGGFGRLAPAHYPADWSTVAALIAGGDGNDDGNGDGNGAVLALPAMTYRQFGWNDRRTQLDPAPWLLPATTITDDSLVVGARVVDGSGVDDGVVDDGVVESRVVEGEDERGRRVRRAAEDGPAALTALGVEWVVVEHGTPGRLPGWLDGLTPRHQGQWVSLYRLGDPAPAPRAGPPAAPVLAADALALAVVAGALLWLVLPVGRVRAPI